MRQSAPTRTGSAKTGPKTPCHPGSCSRGSDRVRRGSDAADLDKGVIFDTAEPGQLAGAPRRIVDFEHDRRDQLGPLRDQRIIGGELVFYLSFAAFLDVQHLLHLLPHRVEILEIECRERADLDPPTFLDLGDLGAALPAHLGVFVERQDIGAGQPAPCRLRRAHGVLAGGSALAPVPGAIP